MTRKYIAIAKSDGTFAVREIIAPTADLHIIGHLRDFDTYEEADCVAYELAQGKYPKIRPAGEYISNR